MGSHGVFLDTRDELLGVGVQTTVYLREKRVIILQVSLKSKHQISDISR